MILLESWFDNNGSRLGIPRTEMLRLEVEFRKENKYIIKNTYINYATI